MNEIIETYYWCIENKIYIPDEGDHLLSLTELILKRYKRKSYLYFLYYSNHFIYNEIKNQMKLEKYLIHYYCSFLDKIIIKKKLCFDIRYIIVSFLV